MTIAAVQTAALGSTSSGTSQQTGAFSAQPTVGNYIVAWCWGYAGGGTNTVTAITFTDTGGNTYTVPSGAFQNLANDLFLAIGYTKVATAGATFKITATRVGTSTIASIMVCAEEFSGVLSASPQDGAAVGTAPGTTAQNFAPGNMTVSAGDLVVAACVTGLGGNPANFSRPGAPWVSVGQQLNGTTFEVGEGMYAINPSSPTNPSWSTAATAVKWGAAQFALKPTATASQLWLPAYLARSETILPQYEE